MSFGYTNHIIWSQGSIEEAEDVEGGERGQEKAETKDPRESPKIPSKGEPNNTILGRANNAILGRAQKHHPRECPTIPS